MAWRRPGDKPLSEPVMVSLLTHICVTRPQWVKWLIIMISHTKVTDLLHLHWFRLIGPYEIWMKFQVSGFQTYLSWWLRYLLWNCPQVTVLTDDKSTLVQVMAWCCPAAIHCPGHCWPRSMLPYGVTMLQWIYQHLLSNNTFHGLILAYLHLIDHFNMIWFTHFLKFIVFKWILKCFTLW